MFAAYLFAGETRPSRRDVSGASSRSPTMSGSTNHACATMTSITAASAFSTCDLCDAHELDTSGAFRVLPPVFHRYGGLQRFCGPVVTLQCHEDNSRVRDAVNSRGWLDTPEGPQPQVLVVAGGGSLRRALVGGNLAAAAAHNGWGGLVVDGAVRDIGELEQAQLPVRALGLVPLRSVKRGEGVEGVPVLVQGVWIRPGEWLYADADGIVVSATRLA